MLNDLNSIDLSTSQDAVDITSKIAKQLIYKLR